MKIGVVHWAFPPVVGGVESHLIYLYGELARMGHDISFLTAPHPQRDDERVGWCTVASDTLMSIDRLLGMPAGPGRRGKVGAMLEGFIRDTSPDVIHAHNLHYFFPDHAESLGLLARKYRIPIVLRMVRISRTPEKRAKYEAELKTLIQKVGAAWGGTQLLTDVYAIEAKIGKVPIAERVTLARKRRTLLRAIAQRIRP